MATEKATRRKLTDLSTDELRTRLNKLQSALAEKEIGPAVNALAAAFAQARAAVASKQVSDVQLLRALAQAAKIPRIAITQDPPKPRGSKKKTDEATPAKQKAKSSPKQ
jgi:hypothetical protein